jgi:hypothetical protein
MYKSLAVSPSTSTAFLCQLHALLAILVLALACICTSAAFDYPSRNPPLLLVKAFCAPLVLESLLLYAGSIVGVILSPHLEI